MISAAIEANTLEEYYDKLYELQRGAHGDDYMLVHVEIKRCLKNCDSYTEFGINQGATLAVALLENPSIVRAYDIKLGWYNDANQLFENYASKHSINYDVTEGDTLKFEIKPVDLLYIDTLHRYDHLTKELDIHAKRANKYIIFHDTAAQPGLKKAVKEYVAAHNEWHIVTDCNDSVGFMTIKKKGTYE